MPDPAEIAAFLGRYVDECEDAGVEPLTMSELAALLRALAEATPAPDRA